MARTIEGLLKEEADAKGAGSAKNVN